MPPLTNGNDGNNKKTISINPQLFSISGSPKATKPKKEKPVMQKPQQHVKNTVKEKLLAQVKKHQLGKQNTSKDDKKTFNDEFNNSLNFMEELARKRNDKIMRQTLKRGKIEKQLKIPDNGVSGTSLSMAPLIQMAPQFAMTSKTATVKSNTTATNNLPTNLLANPVLSVTTLPLPLTFNPTVSVEDDFSAPVSPWIPKLPTYSNLKGGKGLTFRQTQKASNNGINHSVVNAIKATSVGPSFNHDQVTASFKKSLAKRVLKQPHIKKRTNRTLKYKLGKHGKKVSVFIRNSSTRKLVQQERDLLKHKSILEIKNYLRSKNMLKAGSLIPNDVLRQMYESVILAGDVNNTNGNVLVHNYFKDGGAQAGQYKF